MYFYLSKTLGFFVLPSNLILLVVITGLLLWLSRFARLGRRIVAFGAVLLVIAGATPLGTALLLPLENRFPQWDSARGAPDGIIVLGGVLNTYISRRRHDISFGPSAERLIAGVDLLRQYPSARIVFSGGNSNLLYPGMAESDLALRYLELSGIASARIAVDRTSRDTIENAVNAIKIAAPKPGERWLLVTSAFHMPRAVGVFRAAGFPVEPCPVDYKTGGWRDVFGIPGSLLGGFGHLDLAIREWVALGVDWIAGRTSALFPGPAAAP
jgi:uncharacterized SAM-binding protein YcdF (DUF218 family)